MNFKPSLSYHKNDKQDEYERAGRFHKFLYNFDIKSLVFQISDTETITLNVDISTAKPYSVLLDQFEGEKSLAYAIGRYNQSFQSDTNSKDYSTTQTPTNAEKKVAENSVNGYEYEDLGLPSGTKWATCNIGANSPEESGDYYAWGDIKIKDRYPYLQSRTTCKIIDNIKGNPEYDAAQAIWGEPWSIPTEDELTELKDNCTWEWTLLNGVYGYKVAGSKGTIFLPAVGYRHEDKVMGKMDFLREGRYWSSTPGICTGRRMQFGQKE